MKSIFLSLTSMHYGKTAGAILLVWLAFAWTSSAKCDSLKELQEILKQNQCRLQARVSAYDGTTTKQSKVIPINVGSDTPTIAFQDAQWQCGYRMETVADRSDAVDLYVTFRLLEGQAKQTAVSMECVFTKWSADNFVLLPGSVYNGNRYRAVRMNKYPPRFTDPKYHKIDLPITVVDITRLNIDQGESVVEEQTGNLTTPAMGFQSPGTKRGFWLLTEQCNRFGNLGMRVEENDSRTEAIFRVGTPAMRKLRATILRRVPSPDRAADWKTGDEISLRLRLYFFEAPDVQDLFNRFFTIRKDVMNLSALPDVLPWSAAFEIMTAKWNQFHWRQVFYSKRATIKALGWCGNGMETYALLFAGDNLTQKRAYTQLDYVFRHAQASTGLFYDTFLLTGKKGARKPYGQLIRRNGDLLYFFLKHFMLLEDQNRGETIKATWKQAVRKQADALVTMWNRYGQFGQWVNVETGEIIVGGSSSGSFMPAGLALAGKYFKEPKYLDTAKAAAEFYFHRDVLAGVTTGGPGDILQAPDYESAFNMLESLVVLYEITHDKIWLTMAEDMAKQCSTWIVSYDYAFLPQSDLAKLDIKTTGCGWASAQNKCAVPGLCTMSGDCLFKLFRATGNRDYLELIREIAHAPQQCLSRKDRPWTVGSLPGSISERVQMGDWELGRVNVGQAPRASNYWAEVALLLTWCEVPGLYVQPDTGIVCALDHINASVVSRSGNRLLVKLTNPTKFPAKVRVLSESSADARKPLGWSALLNRPIIVLAPGETKTFAFTGTETPTEITQPEKN